MASGAGHLRMSTGQLKSQLAVIEHTADRLHPIVTIKAACSIGLGVGLHKGGIHLLVAAAADCRIEMNKVLYMAVVAAKRSAILFDLVGG